MDGTRTLQAASCGRGRRSDPAFADLRSALGKLSGAVEHVLVCERDTVQRPRRGAALQRNVRRRGTRQRLLGFDAYEGIEDGLPAFNAVEQFARDFDRGELAFANGGGDF